jgi:hypothetical protein
VCALEHDSHAARYDDILSVRHQRTQAKTHRETFIWTIHAFKKLLHSAHERAHAVRAPCEPFEALG